MTGISESNLQTAQEILVSALSAISSNSTAVALLESIERKGPPLYTHAVTCGILCGIMAKIMGWTLEKNILTLTLAGYLHDIGMHQLPLEMQAMDPKEMNEEQRALYEQHPMMGVEELMKIPEVPREVIVVVRQHHENVRGTGFPEALTQSKIAPLTKIVILVDHFCEQLLKLDPKASIVRSKSPQGNDRGEPEFF